MNASAGVADHMKGCSFCCLVLHFEAARNQQDKPLNPGGRTEVRVRQAEPVIEVRDAHRFQACLCGTRVKGAATFSFVATSYTWLIGAMQSLHERSA